MKKIIFLLLIVFSTSFYAQENPRVEFNKNSELLINTKLINNETTYTQIVEMFGRPELNTESKSGEKSYEYEKLGIAFKTNNDKLIMIGFNYNWDGDISFPKTSFTGVLAIGNTQIDANTTKEFMKKNNFLTFNKLVAQFFTAKTAKKGVIKVGFKNEKITQLGFEF